MKIGNLILVVTVFDKIHKEYLVTWKFAKTWKFSMSICLFKSNNRNTETRCEICSKLRIKTPERRQWRQNVVYKKEYRFCSVFHFSLKIYDVTAWFTTLLIILIRFITLKNNWMNPCVKTEGKCNESVNNEFEIMKKNNSLHQVMRVGK